MFGYLTPCLLLCIIQASSASSSTAYIKSKPWLPANRTLLIHDNIYNSAQHSIAECGFEGKSTALYECCVEVVEFFRPQCFYLSESANNSTLKLVSLKYVGAEEELIQWLEMRDGVVVNAKFTDIEWDNEPNGETYIQTTTTISFPINLKESDPRYLNQFVLGDSSSHKVFISSKEHCKIADRCMMSFGGYPTQVSEPEPINTTLVNLSLRSLKDNIIARGNEPGTNRYNLTLLYENGETKDLLSLEDVGQVVNSNDKLYTICYQLKTSNNISCVNFDEDGRSLRNSTIGNSSPLQLVSVVDVWTNATVLFTRSPDCVDGECRTYVVFIIKKDGLVAKQYLDVQCASANKDIIFTLALENRDEIDYACEDVYEKEGNKDHKRRQYVVRTAVSRIYS